MSASRRSLGVKFEFLAGSLLLVMVMAGCLAVRMLQNAAGLSLEVLAWVSWAQLALVFGGLGLLLALAFLVRRFVSGPLSRMSEQMRVMQRAGRLVKMPVTGSEELATFAETFNTLVERIEDQKLRLREHVVELQESHAEMERLAGLKDDFLATISHQFRTPLTSVMEGLELLQDGALGTVPEETMRLLRVMEENVLRLDHLIEEALDLALMKSGRRLLARQPAALDALLRKVEEGWRTAAKEHQLALVCQPLPQVYCDAQAIREVMDHLLRNALRHAPRGTEIVIEARADAQTVHVSVKDTGPGMTAEQLSKLFRPFTHVHTPDAPGSDGGGLGLAICRQVLERHHGAIRAESAAGQGLTVMFELPIATETFLFEEECRAAHDEAQYEHGIFAVLVAAPAQQASEPAQVMQQAEHLLRRNTHRGDRFARFGQEQVVIIAVTDRVGGAAMQTRLEGMLRQAGLPIRMGLAFSPLDGDDPQRILACAAQRAAAPATLAVHATIPSHGEVPASARPSDTSPDLRRGAPG